MTLYNKYKSQNFEVLAFPCNQFGAQESGTNKQIKEFVAKYGVTFPMMDKVEVGELTSHALFTHTTCKSSSILLATAKSSSMPSYILPGATTPHHLSSWGSATNYLRVVSSSTLKRSLVERRVELSLSRV